MCAKNRQTLVFALFYTCLQYLTATHSQEPTHRMWLETKGPVIAVSPFCRYSEKVVPQHVTTCHHKWCLKLCLGKVKVLHRTSAIANSIQFIINDQPVVSLASRFGCNTSNSFLAQSSRGLPHFPQLTWNHQCQQPEPRAATAGRPWVLRTFRWRPDTKNTESVTKKKHGWDSSSTKTSLIVLLKCVMSINFQCEHVIRVYNTL